MRRALVLGVALLALGLAACSDDDKTPTADGAVPDLAPALETSVPDQGTDQAVGLDGPAADLQPAEDSAPEQEGGPDPDTGAAGAVLTATHSGWQTVNCGGTGCHVLPVDQAAYHANATIGDCAECHGGNGACSPPAGHNQAMSCGSSGVCHQDAHSLQLPAPGSCVSCHYASAGTASCP